MTCLDERQLLAVASGDASAAELAHASGCDACRARAARLVRDLGRLDTVLRTTAPPRRTEPRRAPAWRWAPVAVAAVLALAVALERSPTTTTERDDAPDVLALADDFGDAFATDVSVYDDDTPAARTTTSTCTWGDPLLGVGCEQSATQRIAWR